MKDLEACVQKSKSEARFDYEHDAINRIKEKIEMGEILFLKIFYKFHYLIWHMELIIRQSQGGDYETP